jgi:hypothetical protein
MSLLVEAEAANTREHSRAHLGPNVNQHTLVLETQYNDMKPSVSHKGFCAGSAKSHSSLWSHLLNSLLFRLLVSLSAISSLFQVSAAPINTHDNNGGNENSAPGIVINLQDLSAILALFAADTVESKVSDPDSSFTERVSSFWSIFGSIGVVRAYCKIAWGLKRSEDAGLSLAGAGGFTLQKTSKALCCCEVGTQRVEWQDNSGQLLGQVTTHRSCWIRPLIIVVGYSQCPMGGIRSLRECFSIAWDIFHTLLFNVSSILVLLGSSATFFVRSITLAIFPGLAILGALTSSLLMRLNSVGISHLRDMQADRTSAQIIQTGDIVMSSTKTPDSVILWRNPSQRHLTRSADRLSIRVLCGLTAAIVIGAYVSNYILLASATQFTSYIWLSLQILVLIFRFFLWSRERKVRWFHRNRAVLYFVTGSLAAPLSVDITNAQPSGNTAIQLTESVVRFAMASAKNRYQNEKVGSPLSPKLLWLCDGAPGDIFSTPFIRMPDDVTATDGPVYTVVNLSQLFVEEMYIAQGLVLGQWPPGGKCLGAVFKEQQFMGLTTFQSITGNLSEVVGTPTVKGVTYDGYILNNMGCGIVQSQLSDWGESYSDFKNSHSDFQDKLASCRHSAKANGPIHVEVHMKSYAHGLYNHCEEADSNLDNTLQRVKKAIITEKAKNHSSCRAFCQIDNFAYFRPVHAEAVLFIQVISKLHSFLCTLSSQTLTMLTSSW